MDVLRARAYLDLLLGKDSRPRPDAGGQDGAGSIAKTAQGRAVRLARASRARRRRGLGPVWYRRDSPGGSP